MPLTSAEEALREPAAPEYRRGYVSDDVGGGRAPRMLLKHIAQQLEKIQDIAADLDLESRLGNLEDLDDRLNRIESRLTSLEHKQPMATLPQEFNLMTPGPSFTGKVSSNASKTIELATLNNTPSVRFKPPGWPGILRNSETPPAPMPPAGQRSSGSTAAAAAAARSLRESIMSATPKSMFSKQDTVDFVRSSTSSENSDLSAPQSFNTNRATVKRLARRIVMNKSSEQKTEFKETVWEASILLGVHGTGSVGSAFIAVGLSANILVQVVFCLLLREIIKEPFPEELVEGFMRWRLTLGHSWSNVDRDTWVSLVSRLCNRDPSLAVSEKQDTMLEWMEDYLEAFFLFPGATIGCTLVMLTIIIWALIVFKELWEAFHFAQAIVNLPRGVTRFVPTRDDQLRLVAIGNKRFVFMMAVSVARVCIALALLVLGSNLLAFTAELQEVVLNAVALAFVMECDELIFANFIPLSTKVIIRSLVPLSRRVSVYRGVDTTPAANIIAIIVFASCVLGYWVTPMMDMMRLGKFQLCGGNLDFAVAEQGATGMIVSMNTSQYVSGSERLGHATTTWTDLTNDWTVSNWVVAVHELTRYHPPTMSVFQSSQRLFENRVTQTMEQMTENVVLCEDWVFEGNIELLPFLLTIQNATANASASQCKDFTAWCGEEEAMLLRHACPVTCGCRSPRSGLLLNGQRFGCPREACHRSEAYIAALDDMRSCDDYTREDLSADAGWRDFLDQLAAVLSFTAAHDTFEPDMLPLLADAPVELERLGCEALAPGTPLLDTFCHEQHHSYASLHAFCPNACGCESSSFAGCPQACRGKG